MTVYGAQRRGKNPKAQEIRQGPALEGDPRTQLKGMVRKPSTPISTEDMGLAAGSNERISKTERNGDDAVVEKSTSIILDAGDGTGDGLIELPNMLMIRLGWCVGDTLAVALLPGGKIHVQLVAPKKDKFARP